MATSTQLRSWWAGYRCTTSKMVRVPFPGSGRTWDLLVAAEAAPAWRLFADLMVKHNYLFLETAGGTYNCRKIAGTNSWSLHSYGTAVDLNPKKNPYGKPLRHNFPQAFINEVLAQKALDGTPLFRWGGSWATPDAMHWEINCKPSAIPPYQGGGEDQMFDQSTPGPSPAVAMFQRDLIDLGYDLGDFASIQANLYPPGADGWFRGTAETKTKEFQAALGLAVTGKGDALTVATAANLARFAERGGGTVDAYTKADSDKKYALKVHGHSAVTTVK